MTYSENQKLESKADSQVRQNRSQKNQNASISSDSTYDLVKTRLSESEAEAEG